MGSQNIHAQASPPPRRAERYPDVVLYLYFRSDSIYKYLRKGEETEKTPGMTHGSVCCSRRFNRTHTPSLMQPFRISKKQRLPPAELTAVDAAAADAAKQRRAAAADMRKELGMSRTEAAANVAGFGRARGAESQSRKERRKARLNPATGQPFAAERHAAVRVQAICATQEKLVSDLRKEVSSARKEVVSAKSAAQHNYSLTRQYMQELTDTRYSFEQAKREHASELRTVGGQLVRAEREKWQLYTTARDMFRAGSKLAKQADKEKSLPAKKLAGCQKRLREDWEWCVKSHFGSGGVMPKK